MYSTTQINRIPEFRQRMEQEAQKGNEEASRKLEELAKVRHLYSVDDIIKMRVA